MRAVLALLVAATCAACSSAGAAERPAPTPLQRELSGLVAQMERVHPNLYHSVTRERMRAEVTQLVERAPLLSRPQLVVGLMRVFGLLGERDGHSGLFPIDPNHSLTLHAYPLKLYWFPDGLYVIDAADRSLVGARLAAIEDVPADEVVAAVRPLMTRDNESSLRLRLPGFVVSHEVLAGLGITDGGDARFVFADGRSATLRPTTVSAYVSRVALTKPAARRLSVLCVPSPCSRSSSCSPAAAGPTLPRRSRRRRRRPRPRHPRPSRRWRTSSPSTAQARSM